MFADSNLSGGLPTDQILVTSWESLSGLQVAEELFDVATPTICGARGNEAVHLHSPVHSNPEVPVSAADGNSSGRRSDGIDIPEPSQPVRFMVLSRSEVQVNSSFILPDHEFEVSTASRMVWIRGSKDVIRNVGADVVCIVPPRNRSLHAVDLADLSAFSNLFPRIDIAFDVVRGAIPCPCGAPCNAVARAAIQICALGAGTGGVPAPKVVVHFISIS